MLVQCDCPMTFTHPEADQRFSNVIPHILNALRLAPISHPIISDPVLGPDRGFVTSSHDSPGSRALCPVTLYCRCYLYRAAPWSRINPAVTSLRTPTVRPPVKVTRIAIVISSLRQPPGIGGPNPDNLVCTCRKTSA